MKAGQPSLGLCKKKYTPLAKTSMSEEVLSDDSGIERIGLFEIYYYYHYTTPSVLSRRYDTHMAQDYDSFTPVPFR